MEKMLIHTQGNLEKQWIPERYSTGKHILLEEDIDLN